jgi:two-component system chemotaxis response regulator CheB
MSVDDSALMRQIMTEIINSHSDMEMVATAPDPLVARDLIKKFNPDVLTLDVEMPRMDGLDFLEKLMRLRPMPVVMVSSLTGKGSEVTLRALELGAIDFVTKPQLGIREGMLAYSEMIAEKVRTASRARLRHINPCRQPGSVEVWSVVKFGKIAGHWRFNRRNRGNSSCTPAIAAFKSGYSYYSAHAARLHPFVC